MVRIDELMKDMRRTSSGIVRPERLRTDAATFWLGRITQEHRIAYRVGGKGDEQTLEIPACRFYYGLWKRSPRLDGYRQGH